METQAEISACSNKVSGKQYLSTQFLFIFRIKSNPPVRYEPYKNNLVLICWHTLRNKYPVVYFSSYQKSKYVLLISVLLSFLSIYYWFKLIHIAINNIFRFRQYLKIQQLNVIGL